MTKISQPSRGGAKFQNTNTEGLFCFSALPFSLVSMLVTQGLVHHGKSRYLVNILTEENPVFCGPPGRLWYNIWHFCFGEGFIYTDF